MPTIEEMSGWGPEEAQAQIHLILPTDWQFEMTPEGQSNGNPHLRARFTDSTGTEVWVRNSMDPLQLLLDAFGWLGTRNHKPSNPNWVYKDRPRLVPVGKVTLPGIDTPDFKDLDASQISSVYANQKKT